MAHQKFLGLVLAALAAALVPFTLACGGGIHSVHREWETSGGHGHANPASSFHSSTREFNRCLGFVGGGSGEVDVRLATAALCGLSDNAEASGQPRYMTREACSSVLASDTGIPTGTMVTAITPSPTTTYGRMGAYAFCTSITEGAGDPEAMRRLFSAFGLSTAGIGIGGTTTGGALGPQRIYTVSSGLSSGHYVTYTVEAVGYGFVGSGTIGTDISGVPRSMPHMTGVPVGTQVVITGQCDGGHTLNMSPAPMSSGGPMITNADCGFPLSPWG